MERQSWLSALNSKTTKATKVKTVNLVYPEFYEAHLLCEDEFWKKTILQMAQGKISRDFSYTNKLLKYKKKDVYINISELEKDPQLLMTTLINFLRTNTPLRSNKDDEISMVLRQMEISKIQQYEPWTEIKKCKSKKTAYIRMYINEKYHDHPQLAKDILFTQINNLLELGIGKDSNIDIIYEDGRITDIRGIDIDKDCNLTIAVDIKKIKLTKPKKSSEAEHLKDWNKYCANYAKYMNERVPGMCLTVSKQKMSKTSASVMDSDASDSENEMPVKNKKVSVKSYNSDSE